MKPPNRHRVTQKISASMLYDFIRCPHRVHLELFGDTTRKDPESAFAQLLWEQGALFERELIRSLTLPFTDLSGKPGPERARLTAQAMARGDDLIHAGRIQAGDLIGDPDLLKRSADGYTAGDIKSGTGFARGRPKKHYAVQLSLYTDILQQMGASAGRSPFIWDVRGSEALYDLDAPCGTRDTRSWWQVYCECLEQVRSIVSGKSSTTPGLTSTCKTCHWRSCCFDQLEAADDLTLIPELGLSRRSVLAARFKTVSELAAYPAEKLAADGEMPGLKAEVLQRFHTRARLLKEGANAPVVHGPLRIARSEIEVFFDIETDSMRDICYLHGFVERRRGSSGAGQRAERQGAGRQAGSSGAQQRAANSGSERYVVFFADTPDAAGEKKAFADAFSYLQSLPEAVIYYYSCYERTWWLRLQERYPEVAGRDQIKALFSQERAVDLYSDVVQPFTDWPTHDYSIKSLAKFLGFAWRDTSPSGADSIEWYNTWVDSGDPGIRQRILEYNEDDCRAMRVLLDALLRGT